MSSSVHVVAVLQTKPGLRPQLEAAFAAVTPAVLAEDGCLRYIATADAVGAGPNATPYGPDTVVVVEEWASLAALEAHRTAPHMQAFGASVKDLLAERAVHVLSAL
ncbi:MAG: putative quinol monooxygenase [Pseudorhodobacter sp.]|nr:putative quinol monooxygenase [Pseudorhodobacter sp.]